MKCIQPFYSPGWWSLLFSRELSPGAVLVSAFHASHILCAGSFPRCGIFGLSHSLLLSTPHPFSQSASVSDLGSASHQGSLRFSCLHIELLVQH